MIFKKKNAVSEYNFFKCFQTAVVDVQNDVLISYADFENCEEFYQTLSFLIHEANIDVLSNTHHAAFSHCAANMFYEMKKNIDREFVKDDNDMWHKCDLVIEDQRGCSVSYQELSMNIKREISNFTLKAYHGESFFIDCNIDTIKRNEFDQKPLFTSHFEDSNILELTYALVNSDFFSWDRKEHIKSYIFFGLCRLFKHVPKKNAMSELSRIPNRKINFVATLTILSEAIVKQREINKEKKRCKWYFK